MEGPFSSRSRAVLSVSSIILLLCACGLPEGRPDGDSYFTRPDDGDRPGGDTTLPPPNPPQINPLPDSYSFTTIPIRGTSDPAVHIIAQSDTGEAVDTASNGSFCLDFPLTSNTFQTISLRAQRNNDGQFSDAIEVNITHDGTLEPEPPPGSEPHNVALGRSVRSNAIPHTGSLALLTDGVASSLPAAVVYWEAGTNVVVSVDLGKVYDIFQLKIHFGLNYPKKYNMYAATTTSVSLDTSDDAWILIRSADADYGIGGDGGWDSFYLPTLPQARHVAFDFPKPWGFWATLKLDISEIEVWADEPDSSGEAPAPLRPTCANGLTP